MAGKSKGEAKKSNKSADKPKRRNYKKELTEAQKELEKLNDQYIRLLAEFDNYKKRMGRDFNSRVERANVNFIEELLPIIDDFERSFNSKDSKKSGKSFRKGIELIYGKFKAMLEKLGVESIEAIGREFDPEVHEALMQMEVKDKSPNIIVDEAVKGYRYKDTVIRYSKVIVSK